MTTPAPGSAGAPPAQPGASPGQSQTTTTLYDSLSRPWKTLLPDGTSLTNTDHATGERQRSSGSRTDQAVTMPSERGRPGRSARPNHERGRFARRAQWSRNGDRQAAISPSGSGRRTP